MKRVGLIAAHVQFLAGAAICATLGLWVAAGHWLVTALAGALTYLTRRSTRFEVAFVVVLSGQVWLPTLMPTLARSNQWWDVAHFTVSAAVTPVLFGILAHGRGDLVGTARRNLALSAAAMTVAAGVAWELYEWRLDAATGLHLARGYADTMHDLLADTAGAAIGALLVLATRHQGPKGATPDSEAIER